MFTLKFKRCAKADQQRRAREAKGGSVAGIEGRHSEGSRLDRGCEKLRGCGKRKTQEGEAGYTRMRKPLAPIPAARPEATKTGGAALIENCACLANFINAAAGFARA